MNGIEEAKLSLEAAVADGGEFPPRLMVLNKDGYVAVMDLFPDGRPPNHVPVALGLLWALGGEGGSALIVTDAWMRSVDIEAGETEITVPESGSLGDDPKSVDALIVLEVKGRDDVLVHTLPYVKDVVNDRLVVSWGEPPNPTGFKGDEGIMLDAIRAGFDSHDITGPLTPEQRCAVAVRFGHAVAIALPDFDVEAMESFDGMNVERVNLEDLRKDENDGN